MVINLNLDVENGGTMITLYEIEVKDSANLAAPWTPVTNYDGVSPSYTLHVATDTFLIPGTIYDIRFRAKNLIGYSDYSDYLRQALNSIALAPANLRRVEKQCTKSQIVVTWDQVADGIMPGGEIRGYFLYMANGSAGSYYMVYNGTDRPLVRTWVLSNLTPGEIYRFKVSALTFNAEGQLSTELHTYSCIKPSLMAAPLRVTSTAASMTLAWSAPSDDGGCTITGYAVFRNDGQGGTSWTEVNADQDTNVRDRPTLLGMMVTAFPANSAGKEFEFKVIAYNRMGEVSSDTSSYVLASEPAAPANGPFKLSQSGSEIAIRYDALTTTAQTGGSVVLGYNLQMDDGMGGAFVDVYGSAVDPETANNMFLYYTAEKLTRGRRYGFRYRARNHYGYSVAFSPVTYILAIEPPQMAPPMPALSSASDNQITLDLYLCPDDGSSALLGYELWMSEGLESSSYT